MNTAAIREKLNHATETGRARILAFETEAQKLVEQLAQKGREAQAEGQRRIENLKPKLTEATAPVLERLRTVALGERLTTLKKDVEDAFGGGLGGMAHQLGLATREDLDKLQRRLETLSTRVSELSRAQKKAAHAARRRDNEERKGRKAK